MERVACADLEPMLRDLQGRTLAGMDHASLHDGTASAADSERAVHAAVCVSGERQHMAPCARSSGLARAASGEPGALLLARRLQGRGHALGTSTSSRSQGPRREQRRARGCNNGHERRHRARGARGGGAAGHGERARPGGRGAHAGAPQAARHPRQGIALRPCRSRSRSPPVHDPPCSCAQHGINLLREELDPDQLDLKPAELAALVPHPESRAKLAAHLATARK